jgi:hypothetical protein
MGEYYGFDGEPITMLEWAILWEGDRHVAEAHIGDARVSTVWLGLNHRFIGDGPPLIYESMVFGGILDGERDRYTNWNAALAGHDQLCAQVSASQRVDGRIGTD